MSRALLSMAVALALSSGAPAQAADSVVISEIMPANSKTLASDTGRFEDWIELRNLSEATVSLAGWSLKNGTRSRSGWTFPATNLPPSGHLLLWASGLDRREPGAPLHTSFKLSSSGEYLALIRPDGSVASEFAPAYPALPPDVSYGLLPGARMATPFSIPTPGTANESSTNLPGGVILSVKAEPAVPKPNEPVKIVATVASLLSPIKEVALQWRASFHRETNVVMKSIGEGLWEAVIPAGSAAAGEILRWRVTVRDEENRLARSPMVVNAERSSRYHGVQVERPPIVSQLPVFELFVPPTQMGRMDSESGGRGCLVYDGEFYDNVFIKVRGNTTAGFPKKSHRLEFPHDHPFRHPGPGGRVKHTSLMAEFGDPTYLRQYLSFWLQTRAGSAAPFHYPVRVEMNGAFYQLAMHSEVLGEELLARHGLDPNGALYKAIGTLSPGFDSTGGFEKKTRRYEEMDDYMGFARAIGASRSNRALRRALFEQTHLPSVLNYLAAARISQEDDDVWANMSIYRDSDGTQEWRPIPFDMNVSWGFSFATGEVLATEDGFRSHPFFGANGVGANQGFNRLYNAVVRVPETRAMLLRRMRTLMDRSLQPPGTPIAQRLIESEISSLTNRFWNEALLDRAKWGAAWTDLGRVKDNAYLATGVNELIQRFIEPRRTHLYITHSVTNRSSPIGISSENNVGIPQSQSDPQRVGLARWDAASEAPYVTVTNGSPDAVDLSGWRLTGGMKFTFEEGTVLPAQGQLQVASDIRATRQRLSALDTNAVVWVVGGRSVRWGDGAKVNLRDALDHKVSEIGSR